MMNLFLKSLKNIIKETESGWHLEVQIHQVRGRSSFNLKLFYPKKLKLGQLTPEHKRHNYDKELGQSMLTNSVYDELTGFTEAGTLTHYHSFKLILSYSNQLCLLVIPVDQY